MKLITGWPYLIREMNTVWRMIWIIFLMAACGTSVYALVNITFSCPLVVFFFLRSIAAHKTHFIHFISLIQLKSSCLGVFVIL